MGKFFHSNKIVIFGHIKFENHNNKKNLDFYPTIDDKTYSSKFGIDFYTYLASTNFYR